MGLQFVQLRVSIGNAMANRRPSRCDRERCIRKHKRHHVRCAKRRHMRWLRQSFQMTFSAAGRAARPRCSPWLSALRSRPLVERSPEAASLRARFIPRVKAISPKPSGRQISIRSGAQAAGITLCRNQPQHPSASPFPRSAIDPTDRAPLSSYPILDTLQVRERPRPACNPGTARRFAVMVSPVPIKVTGLHVFGNSKLAVRRGSPKVVRLAG